MRKIFSLAILSFCIFDFACKKDVPPHETKKYGYILAGDSTGDGVTFHSTVIELHFTSGIEIDLDHDGKRDFTFWAGASHSGASYHLEEVLLPDENTYFLTDSNGVAVNNLHDTISDNIHWMNKGTHLYGHVYVNYPGDFEDYEYGNWEHLYNKYIGFKIVKPQKILYGWICFDAIVYADARIHGWAYRE